MSRRGVCAVVALVVAPVLAGAACTLDTRVAVVGTDAGPPPQLMLVPAGAPLPDEASCAARVRPAPEVRNDNVTPNHDVVTAADLAKLDPWDDTLAFDRRALDLQTRVSGAFTGTTDELLQWAACKWGFDADALRAEAVRSSGWLQTLASDWTMTAADCPPGADMRPSDGECAQTYGIFQIVWQYHKSAWPGFRASTPFHLDYIFGLRRVCFEGWDLGQAARATAGVAYAAGDYWGCVGAHFSGGWYDPGANLYISAVKQELVNRAWTSPGF
jgi:autotransporter family porin